ncbi:hypothetical protein ACE6H2_003719 [Prunus campanulata]
MAKKMMLKVVILVSLLILQLADSQETSVMENVIEGANYRQGRIYARGHAGLAARDAIAFHQALLLASSSDCRKKDLFGFSFWRRFFLKLHSEPPNKPFFIYKIPDVGNTIDHLQMDKPRDVRRGATRFKQPSGHKLFSCLAGVGADAGGDFVQSAKSKKERLRKLSALGTASSSFQNCEMGCDVSDREDELPSKRFKLPKKFFDDCNGVDHASVPRKLRSAMKKRNRESASPSIPNSKKLNHTMSGIESPKRDGVNKPKPYLKQGGSDRSLRETVSGDITKDEEEVVETLYALAGLFPNNDANDNSKLDTESLDANPSALPEFKETPTPAFEGLIHYSLLANLLFHNSAIVVGRLLIYVVVLDSAVGNDKLGSICPLKATKASSPSSVERLAKETDQVDSLNKSSTQSEPELPNSRKFCTNSDDSVPHELNISSVSAIVEECNEKPTANVVKFSVPSDLSLDSRLKQPVQKESSIFGRKPETALELGKTMGSQVEVHNMVQESKKNGIIHACSEDFFNIGPVLWPGLSSNVSHGARNDSPSSSSQSPAAKIPAWLDAALSTSRASVQNVSSFGKVKRTINLLTVTNVLNGRRTWKKCAAHVYISHLIQALQNSENKDKLQPNEMRQHEGSKQVALLGANIYTKVKNGIVSASSIDISSAEKRPNEAKNGILEQKKLYQDQPESAMGSRAYPSPKQSFDFLSLSAGGGGLETNDSFSRARNGMEPSSQSQVPYIQSLMQHHTLIPFSLPQSHFSSSSCPNNPSAAQQKWDLLLHFVVVTQ